MAPVQQLPQLESIEQENFERNSSARVLRKRKASRARIYYESSGSSSERKRSPAKRRETTCSQNTGTSREKQRIKAYYESSESSSERKTTPAKRQRTRKGLGTDKHRLRDRELLGRKNYHESSESSPEPPEKRSLPKEETNPSERHNSYDHQPISKQALYQRIDELRYYLGVEKEEYPLLSTEFGEHKSAEKQWIPEESNVNWINGVSWTQYFSQALGNHSLVASTCVKPRTPIPEIKRQRTSSQLADLNGRRQSTISVGCLKDSVKSFCSDTGLTPKDQSQNSPARRTQLKTKCEMAPTVRKFNPPCKHDLTVYIVQESKQATK